MAQQTNIQYISNNSGDVTAVIVPIELWKELSQKDDTTYLMESETMAKRLIEARNRNHGIPWEEACEKLGI